MTSLSNQDILKLVDSDIYINGSTNPMEVAKYIALHHCLFNEDELKLIDIYWDSAFNRSWLYVSNAMVQNMFGYKVSKYMMNDFAKKLKKEFEENIDYQIVGDTHELIEQTRSENFPTEISYGGQNKKHYIITGETFKSLLLMSRTQKGRETRKYYLKVEELSVKTVHAITSCMNILSNKQITQLKNSIQIKDNLLQEKDEQMDRMHNTHKELLTYKKRVTKTETIYIVSTANYSRQGIFKIGRTRNAMKFRSSGHNVSHIQGDKIKVIREFQVNDSVLVERNIHQKIKGLSLEGETEFFLCPYDLLESLVDLIVRNDDQENDMVNKIIDTVFRLKVNVLNSQDWTQGIPQDTFREVLYISDSSEEKLIEMDVSLWNEEHKRIFVANCLVEYQKINASVGARCIFWKVFQPFLIQQLSIPKYLYKTGDWKPLVIEESKKAELLVKWRG